jgi:hypothetical protein
MTNPLLYFTRPVHRLEALAVVVILHEAGKEHELVSMVVALETTTKQWLEKQPPAPRAELQAIGREWTKAVKEGRKKLQSHSLKLPDMRTPQRTGKPQNQRKRHK